MTYEHYDAIVEGKRYYLRAAWDRAGTRWEEFAFDGESSRYHVPYGGHGKITPGRNPRFDTSGDTPLELMLLDLSRVPSEWEGRYGPELPKFSLLFRASGATPTLRPHLEYVGGELCHVVELVRKREDGSTSRRDVLWIAHEKGMCVMKREVYGGASASPAIAIEVQEIAETSTETRRIWYPAVAHKTMRSEGDDVQEEILTVEDLQVNVPTEPNMFHFEFPHGTRVWDRVVDMHYYVGNTMPIDEAVPDDDTMLIDSGSQRQKIVTGTTGEGDSQDRLESKSPNGEVNRELEILESICEAYQKQKDSFGQGQGVANVVVESSYEGGREEHNTVEFKYRESLSRYDLYLCDENGTKRLLHKKAVTPRVEIWTNGEDAIVEKPGLAVETMFGKNMHPSMFNSFYGQSLELWLNGVLKAGQEGRALVGVEIDKEGYLRLTETMLEENESDSIVAELVIDTKDGFRIISGKCSSIYESGRKDLRNYEVEWVKKEGQWYVKTAKYGFELRYNEEGEWKTINKTTSVEIVKHEVVDNIDESEFSLAGMVEEGVYVRDKLAGLAYTYRKGRDGASP